MPSTKFTPISTSSNQPISLNVYTCFRVFNCLLAFGMLILLSWLGIIYYLHETGIMAEDSPLEIAIMIIPFAILTGIGGAVVYFGTAFGLTLLCRDHPQWVPAFIRTDRKHPMDEECGDADAEEEIVRREGKAKMVKAWVWAMRKVVHENDVELKAMCGEICVKMKKRKDYCGTIV